MLALFSRWATQRPWTVVVTFLIVGVLSGAYGIGVQRELAAAGLEDPGSEAAQARTALMEELEVGEPDLMVVLGSPERPLTDALLEPTLRALDEALTAVEGVRKVHTPLGRREGLRSADSTRALVLVELAGDARAKSQALQRVRVVLDDADVDVQIGGPAAAEATAQELAVHDLKWAEIYALPVVTVLLLIFFRGPWAAALPLAVGVFAVPASFAVLRVLAQLTEVSVFALNVGTFIGTGLAIDYAMVLVQRFRDELALGSTGPEAVDRMLRTSGRAIVVSGVTVAGSLLALLVFPLGILWSIGVSGALVVLCAMAAALVLLPALLVILAPKLGSSTPAPDEGRAWARIATFVMARPVLITVVVLVGLAVAASPSLRLRTIMPDVSTFPRDTDVRQVDELLDDPAAFGATSQTPVLVYLTTESRILDLPNVAAVAAYVDAVEALPGVRVVRSPFATPSLRKPDIAKTLLGNPALMPPALRGALQLTTRTQATVIEVVPTARWRSDEAAAVVRAVRGVSVPGIHTLVGGPTALILDARDALSAKLPLALALVVGVNLVLLFVAFGSVVVPIKAVLMNVASIGASFGALVWIFQDGHLTGLFGFEPPGGIDLTVPVVMFAVIFGLSMDYEVFLLSRIKEEMDRTGNNALSVARGLQHTGSVITRAALLLLVVVAGFTAGRFLFIQELGVGMVVAIALDATIVRALLVPATMVLLGDANWWAPAPLRRLWLWLDLEVRE